MSEPGTRIPPCPITGLPAARLIQWVSSNLLNGLWRASFGVDTTRQLGTGQRFGLWESPCGLIFFDPMIVGDGNFYGELYKDLGQDGPWSESASNREDYRQAAAMIKPGDRVLDVGCGAAAFASYVPHAAYVGLDDNYPPAGAKVTEASLNNFPSKDIADQIEKDPYRFLICADKFGSALTVLWNSPTYTGAFSGSGAGLTGVAMLSGGKPGC